jgi:butyrate kinase
MVSNEMHRGDSLSIDLNRLRASVDQARRAADEIGQQLTTECIQLCSMVKIGAEDPILTKLLGTRLAELVQKTGWNSLIINPGSTSTKVAVYNGLNLHAQAEVPLAPGSSDGIEERVATITSWFTNNGLVFAELSGIAARGGFIAPVPSGTYRISKRMVEDLGRAFYQHASNLAVPIALRLAELVSPDVTITITDPVTVDELATVYRITGSAAIRNDGSAVHYLNHRAAATVAAHIQGVEPDALHLITAHMGGGMSAVRHADGRMLQVSSAFGGMPSANRSGALPLHQVIRLMEQKEYTLDDLKRDVMSSGGLLSLAGTNDFRALFAFRDQGATEQQRQKIDLLIEFYANRVAGAIAELSATSRPLDLVLLTGGLAHDQRFCQMVADRIMQPVPVARLPGSVEQQALTAGLLRACADPGSREDYFRARDTLAALRHEEDQLLAVPIFTTPRIKPDETMPNHLNEIVKRAAACGPPPVIALVGADNEEALLAARLANTEDQPPLVRFLLLGPYNRISQLAWELDVTIDGENYILVDTADPAATAVELLKTGLADTLMKGNLHTAQLLKAYLTFLKGQGGTKTRLSHLGLFEIPGRPKLVCVTDAAMNTYPDVEARIEILENALLTLRHLGYQRPKVAVISAVEKASAAVSSSLEAKEIADHFKDRFDLTIEGPLSVDIALSPESANEKSYPGKIQGDADVLLVPNIDTGNAIYKAFTVTSGAATAGTVIGGPYPLILTSRGDSSRSKLSSIALAVLLIKKMKGGVA